MTRKDKICQKKWNKYNITNANEKQNIEDNIVMKIHGIFVIMWNKKKEKKNEEVNIEWGSRKDNSFDFYPNID